jgi:hypothetical protein
MPPKRPAKLKQSIAKLSGVDRERAVYAQSLMEHQEYARESADLLAFVVFPLDDGISHTREFGQEVGSLSMDVAAFAETSTPGAAVHAAAMAVHAMHAAAVTHNESHYVRRLDVLKIDLPSIEARFGE